MENATKILSMEIPTVMNETAHGNFGGSRFSFIQTDFNLFKRD